MRCGPAYGLNGQLSTEGPAQNRVVIDGLAERPEPWTGCSDLLGAAARAPVDLGGSSAVAFSACLEPSARLLAVRLWQEFSPLKGGKRQHISLSALLASP
jgi:hypothetical protein